MNSAVNNKIFDKKKIIIYRNVRLVHSENRLLKPAETWRKAPEGGIMEYCDSVDRLNRILVRGHRIIQSELLKLGVDDLVPSHGAVLEHLKAMGIPQPVTELVTALRRPKSSITKATDCLENGGYVFKKPNPGDGRSYLVGLTPSGVDVLEQFRKAYAVLEKKLFANITEEQKNICLQTLSEMEANLK